MGGPSACKLQVNGDQIALFYMLQKQWSHSYEYNDNWLMLLDFAMTMLQSAFSSFGEFYKFQLLCDECLDNDVM